MAIETDGDYEDKVTKEIIDALRPIVREELDKELIEKLRLLIKELE